MKILYLTPGVFDKGGIARYCRFQIRALREAFGEKNVKVASLMGRQYGDLEEPFEVDFAGSMPANKASRALFSLATADLARRSRPDVVLCAHVNMGPMAFLLAKAARARFVQNVYGRELWTSAGLSWPHRKALGRADLVISDCHNTADRALEMGLVKTKPAVVWDCVDIDRYCPAAPDWSRLERYGLKDDGRFKVMFLGRINSDTRYKGFERLLRVVSKLPAEGFEAVLAGKGDDIDRMRALAVELGIAHRATITGAIHEDDMPDVYRAADAFYLVSEVGPGMGEGIPLTPMEAMACGVPVLVGNQDGSRELLEGDGGWCGDPSDLDAQGRYLEALAGDEQLHQKEIAAAAARAAEVFSYERFAEETKAGLLAMPAVSRKDMPR
jgi:phosphatidylinositol alpha-1,6-mannosyltransferase